MRPAYKTKAKARPKKGAPVLIDLALQGEGSHSAFTWGVLDRLLEEPLLRFVGISGFASSAIALSPAFRENCPRTISGASWRSRYRVESS
jgi:predicted patatin/cPLA2 family phospholipase